MIQELIAMAKDIQSALSRGQELGLSAEEEAFCPRQQRQRD